MRNNDKDFISEMLDVEPIKITSALLTAQSRNRYFRTNIPGVKVPEDKGVMLADILEEEVAEKYFVDRQKITYKQISLTGEEKTPATFVERKTEIAKLKHQRNKERYGIEKSSRSKEDKVFVVRD